MIRSLSVLGLAVVMAIGLARCSSPASQGKADAGPGNADAGGTNDHPDAGKSPGDGGNPDLPDAGQAGNVGLEQAALSKIADAIKSFHKDTTGWPYGGSAWVQTEADMSRNPDVLPGEFTDNDTALFTSATLHNTMLPACPATNQPCWGGPYLTGGPAMGSPTELDAWGHKRLFTIIGSNDGFGGQPEAQDGLVVIWSAGPDGLDQTGCVPTDVGDPGCQLDWAKLAAGKISADKGDDVIVVVATNIN